MTIKSFDRTTAVNIGEAVARELAAFAEKHGLSVTYAGGQLGTTEFVCKVKFEVKDKSVVAESEESLWKHYAAALGLNPDAFGKTFLHNGIGYRICGLAPSRPKNCVKAKCLRSGREYIFPAAVSHRVMA